MSSLVRAQSAFASGLDALHRPSAGRRAGDVVIADRPGLAQFQVVPQRGEGMRLAEAVARLTGREAPLPPRHGAAGHGFVFFATGPLEMWVMAQDNASAHAASGALEGLLGLGERVAVFDQSAARAVLALSGPCAEALLDRGTTLDLAGGGLPAPGAAHTMAAHIPILLVRRSRAPVFELSVPRSWAGSFLAWLARALDGWGSVVADGEAPSISR